MGIEVTPRLYKISVGKCEDNRRRWVDNTEIEIKVKVSFLARAESSGTAMNIRVTQIQGTDI
jgi:hypothetical protein